MGPRGRSVRGASMGPSGMVPGRRAAAAQEGGGGGGGRGRGRGGLGRRAAPGARLAREAVGRAQAGPWDRRGGGGQGKGEADGGGGAGQAGQQPFEALTGGGDG